MWLKILKVLLWFSGTKTAKEIGRYAVRKVVDSTDSNIDNELAAELLGDISKSNGNAIKQTALKEVKDAIKEHVDIEKVSSGAYNFLTDRVVKNG